MKQKYINLLIIIIIGLLTIFSCTEDLLQAEESLEGEWEVIEIISFYGNTGVFFLITGMLLSGYFTYCAFSLRKTKSENDAWNLFKFSNIYLYSLFICLVIDSAYLIDL